MTWHLKDRELEKKLIAIDPKFIDKLQMTKGYDNYGFHLNLGGYVYSGDCGVPKIQVYFVQEDLEEVLEYNPKAWNEYPKVTPPENVLMLVEFKDGSLGKAFFKKGIWKDIYDVMYSYKPVRYRPWKD